MEASEYKNVTRDAFALAPLDSRLFDSKSTPLLNKVSFPNHVWQKVIELMSLSRSQKGINAVQGCINYSINQLGAVYEACFLTGDFLQGICLRSNSRVNRPLISWIVPGLSRSRIDYREEIVI